MIRKQVYFLTTTLFSLFLMSIVLVSCSEDEDKPKPVEVSGIFTANVDIESDFVSNEIKYGPYEGGIQVFGTETTTKRGIEFILFKDTDLGTYTIDNTPLIPDLYAFFHGDVEVLLSREDPTPITPGTFTVVKYDADSLVANFNFDTSTRIITDGVIKLKLK